jgi:transposase-like protein
MDKLQIRLKGASPQKCFSESFKKQVVKEFEQGGLTKQQLQLKYGLKGHSQVLKWCRKYGKFAYSQNSFIGRSMKDPQKQRIKELESKLKAAELRLKVYDKLIEVTNRELDTDIIKKIEAKLSESWRQKDK